MLEILFLAKIFLENTYIRKNELEILIGNRRPRC
jgi:hypothetical protein